MSEHSLPGVKVPADPDENRALKAGHVEDDNEDIAYLNFRIIWPISVTTLISCFFLVLTVWLMEAQNHISFENFALNQLFFTYGRQFGFCNNTVQYEDGMYPSLLRQVEMKVLCNIFFRVAVCLPLAVRIFVAFLVRNEYRQDESTRSSLVFRSCNEVSVILAVAEFLSLSLFSIITIRFDFPLVYKLCFSTFIVASTFQMFLRTVLAVAKRHEESLDGLSMVLKLLTTLSFVWSASKFYDNHLRFIEDTGCHGYVGPQEAVTEYAVWVSYLLFNLTNLIDIRDFRFVCFPRTCSGECEPVEPANFQPGKKYEHCRAYELNQRQLLGKS